MTRQYYILNPCPDINSLCASMLDESCFHSSLAVSKSEGPNSVSVKNYFAWNVTLQQLQEIYRTARGKGIPLTHFRVAISRTKFKIGARIAQKKEYVEGYQSQRKRPERLKEIQAKRKAKLRGE